MNKVTQAYMNTPEGQASLREWVERSGPHEDQFALDASVEAWAKNEATRRASTGQTKLAGRNYLCKTATVENRLVLQALAPQIADPTWISSVCIELNIPRWAVDRYFAGRPIANANAVRIDQWLVARGLPPVLLRGIRPRGPRGPHPKRQPLCPTCAGTGHMPAPIEADRVEGLAPPKE